MNTKYVIMENRAYVFNDERRTIKKPLTDNLEEILKQENKIELIEGEIKKNKEENRKATKELESDKKMILWGFPCILLAGLLFAGGLNIRGNNPLIFATWNLKEVLFHFGAFACGLMGFCWSLDGVVNYRNSKRKIARNQMQNFFLEKNLETEKNYLKELEELAVKVEQEEFSNLIDIDNKLLKEKLKEYKEKLNFYQKRTKKFYHKPMGENFKTEMYRNGIDAEIFEEYVASQKRSLKK